MKNDTATIALRQPESVDDPLNEILYYCAHSAVVLLRFSPMHLRPETSYLTEICLED